MKKIFCDNTIQIKIKVVKFKKVYKEKKVDKKELSEELNKLTNKSSVEDVQKYIKDMIETRNFRTNLMNRMCLLTEEVGELAKEIRKASKDEGLITDLKQAKDSNLENEMVDVFICLMGMFELLDIKLVDALKRKENKNYNREWE